MESLTKILFDFDKLPSKLLLIVCILSGIILFVPAEFLVKVKLDKFNESYGQWVGISFFVTLSFLVVSIITSLQKKWKSWKWSKSIEKDIRNSLNQLDPLEQSILREFFIAGSTVNLPMDNATVIGLQDKYLIRLAQSNLGGSYIVSGNFGLPFMLTNYAREVIQGNINLIGLPQSVNNQITDHQKHWLGENRPPWIRRDFF